MEHPSERDQIPVSEGRDDESSGVTQVFVGVFEDRITDVHETRVLFIVPSAKGVFLSSLYFRNS